MFIANLFKALLRRVVRREWEKRRAGSLQCALIQSVEDAVLGSYVCLYMFRQ